MKNIRDYLAMAVLEHVLNPMKNKIRLHMSDHIMFKVSDGVENPMVYRMGHQVKNNLKQ